MRRLFSIFVVLLLLVGINDIYSQAQIDIPITISNNATVPSSTNMFVGLDQTATSGLDPALGEANLPPLPPAGVWDARFTLGAQASLRDYRNVPSFPFTGSITHNLTWQQQTGGSSVTINYNVPVNAVITIQDVFGGVVFNSGPQTGTGSYTITASATSANIIMAYTDIVPPEPSFSISPVSPLIIAPTVVGLSNSANVTVSNTGTLALDISNITSSNAQFTFTPNTFPVSIAAGGHQIFVVTFTPTANGNQSADLTFTHNAAGSPTLYTVQGVGYTPAPVFGVSPASLNFGSVNVGENAVLPFTVNNTGDAQLTLTNIVSSDVQYTFAPNAFPIDIAVGGNVVFNVTFTPSGAGTQNAELTFTHNAAGSPFLYSLTGNGVTTAPIFAINPVSLDFGQVSVGGSSTVPVTVSNTGNAQLVLSGIVSTDPQFTFAPNTFPVNIAVDGNAVINVTYTPIVAGPVTGNLTFSHNAEGSPSTLTLQGTGRTQGGSLEFVQQTRTLYDGTTNNQDAIVLRGYTGQPLKALQFDLILGKANHKLILNSVSRGDGIPASDFSFDYQVYPGPIQPDGSHRDSIKVVILGNTDNAILPGTSDVEIMKFSYDVVSITGNSTTTSNGFENVFGATGTPVVNANITSGPDELLTIYNGTINGLLGDVNLDDNVDLLDILTMIDYILGRITLTGQAFTNGDISPWIAPAPLPSPDGVINVLDLAVLQNIVLTGLYPNSNPVNRALGNPFVISELEKITSGMDAKLTFNFYKTGITVGLESKVKVKGVQIELNGVNSTIPTNTQISSVFDQKLYYQLNDFLRTLTYDGQSLPLEAGTYLLANLPFNLSEPKDIEINKIIIADENNNALQKVEVEIKYDEVQVVPSNYSLSQNFPNPFNPNTSIQFSIPKDGFVTVKVYNLLGQVVADLHSGNAQAGTYNLNWDGKDNSGNFVSSGNYIYRITAADFTQSKKMLFLK
ncbi:MAG: choice-of-anchor D domain-containing protein [Ignavibacteria bacterium]|nr:choice-of-anchor D domain-containing protein [Ignavibacteria bacterium]